MRQRNERALLLAFMVNELDLQMQMSDALMMMPLDGSHHTPQPQKIFLAGDVVLPPFPSNQTQKILKFGIFAHSASKIFLPIFLASTKSFPSTQAEGSTPRFKKLEGLDKDHFDWGTLASTATVVSLFYCPSLTKRRVLCLICSCLRK